MKTFIKHITVVVLSVLVFSGCNKWLDVKPTDQITQERLFSEGIGFRNALNGIYQYIAEGNLYGRNLSWGLNSALAQDYIGNDISQEYQNAATTFVQTDPTVLAIGTNIWGNAYKAIANSNKLINEIKTKDTGMFQFGNVEKKLILGEAIALRAMLHFELVRLFAPSPAQDLSGQYIPYVDKYPSYYTAPSPTSTVLQNIQKDLEEAKVLVAENDTILNRASLSTKLNSRLVGSNVAEERFFSFRMMRLNHVAIAGLLAKVALYAGDVEKALSEAAYVYTYGPSGTKKWWEFTSSTNAAGVNIYTKFADDVLFGSFNTDLVADITAYKGTTVRYRINKQVSAWFPAAERDYRLNLLIPDAVVSTDLVSQKWIATNSTGTFRSQQNTFVPVLRLSEIYYIYSEALYRKGLTADALGILNQVRVARGKINTFTDQSETGFYNELLNEYRREFLTEGQTIFAYKRLGRDMQISSQLIPMDERFTFKIPEGEVIN
jgi:hypothetical protein